MDSLLGFCWVSLALICASASAEPGQSPAGSTTISVAAVADDVQSAIFLENDGQMRRYQIGATVAGSDWRILRIADHRVVLESSGQLDGRPLDMRLEAGQRVDLNTFDTAVAALRTGLILPAAVSLHPVKRESAPGH